MHRINTDLHRIEYYNLSEGKLLSLMAIYNNWEFKELNKKG